MVYFDISDREALTAARQLHLFGVDLPADAAKWLDKLHALRADPPAEAPPNRVAELIADSASPAAIDKALANAVSQHLRAGQHRHAQQLCGQRVLAALLDDRERLHRELSITANELIDRLTEAASITQTVVELTKERRVAEAHIVACAESDAGDLRALYTLRDDYLTPPTARWDAQRWSCRYFANPWDVRHPAPGGDGQWEQWKSYIKAGAELWFPSFEEAVEAVNAHQPTPSAFESELVTPTANLTGMFTG